MALSFTAGSVTLANWGISAGDIALIAGAGRVAGNWLMAQVKDRNLLDFMHVDPEHIIIRKGIVDVTESHRRWNRKLVLLQNGKKVVLQQDVKGSAGPLLENMDKFTWVMTFIVAALDAALDSSTLRVAMSSLLLDLFSEAPSGLEYLEHELNLHIQGWMSAACVRSISLQARRMWTLLEREGRHYPGFTPDSDLPEVSRFLAWVCGKDVTERRFLTASSDVYCIAVVLADIGMCFRCCSQGQDLGPDEVCVVFDPALIGTGGPDIHDAMNRCGVRYPMDTMVECVSVWPPIPGYKLPLPSLQEELRSIYNRVTQAVATDGIRLVFRARRRGPEDRLSNHRLVYEVLDDSRPVSRAASTAHGFAGNFLLRHSEEVMLALAQLLQTFNGFDRGMMETNNGNFDAIDSITMPSVVRLQVFLLAYYSAVLKPLIDVTQLTGREGFGGWGFCDTLLFKFIADMRNECGIPEKGAGGWRKAGIADPSICIPRENVLQLVAYFFAGATRQQLSSASSSTIGIVGKNFVAISTLIGSPSNNDELGSFCLLDVDTSAIPTDLKGLVTATGAHLPKIQLKGSEPCNLLELGQNDHAPRSDFTMHIEPDWENDTQKCLVAHRHEGRLAWKIDPLIKLEALHFAYVEQGLPFRHRNLYRRGEESATHTTPWLSQRLTLSDFHGGILPCFNDSTVRTRSHLGGSRTDGFVIEMGAHARNVQACIIAAYHNTDMDFVLVGSLADAQSFARDNRSFRGLFMIMDGDSTRYSDLTEPCRIQDFYPMSTHLYSLNGPAMDRVTSGWY